MKQRYLIVGGDSQIGHSLRQKFEREECLVDCTSRRSSPANPNDISLDLTTISTNTSLPAAYEAAVICAGITDVRYCEANPETTRFINITQTLKLVQLLMQQNCFVVYLSSNMVFDGANPSVNLHHPKNPKTEYGYQKARIEEELLQAGYDCAIVRLTKVAAGNMPILNNWQKNLEEGKSIRPFSDYICSLVGMDQATACLFHFARFKKRGLWHVSAPDEVSYAMLANRYLQFRGLSTSLAQPISAQEAGFNFYLPSHTTLDASLTEKEMKFTFAPSMDAFEKLLTHVVT